LPDDFHEVLGAQLADHWPEDTCANGLTGVVEDNSRVAVKPNGCAVFATDLFGRANDDGLAGLVCIWIM